MTKLRYECALIRNWLDGTPVFPIFAADITGHDASGSMRFQRVDYGITFPELPHQRGKNAQRILDDLGYIAALASHNTFINILF